MKLENNQPSAVDFNIELVAENALLLSWHPQVSSAQHHNIITLQAELKDKLPELILESVASYHCLMIYYPFQHIAAQTLIEHILAIASQQNNKEQAAPTAGTIRIPVYYDIEQQWDLNHVATSCQLSTEQVIKLHSSTVYRSYALGFTPGFCYLASLPKAIVMPRKASPRIKVPKGAVAIAEQQTAVYPNESPGGWHIIGQTPIPMYHSVNGQFSATINVGQSVQFYRISKAQFITMQQELQHG